jgi:hypothetical protein
MAEITQISGQMRRPAKAVRGAVCARWTPKSRKEKMNRTVLNLIAAAERCGYADVPPGSVNDETESELAAFGYAVSLSDRLWLGGFRI